MDFSCGADGTSGDSMGATVMLLPRYAMRPNAMADSEALVFLGGGDVS